MTLIARTIITALFAISAHITGLVMLTGAPTALPEAVFHETVARWTIAAFLAHSIAWPLPSFATALIVGVSIAVISVLSAAPLASAAFSEPTLIANGWGAIGLAIGAMVASAILKSRTDKQLTD